MRFEMILMFLLTFATPALAVTAINETLPEFTGVFSFGPFPILQPVGDFISIPAGESVVSGSIAGTFGNSASFSSAQADIFLGDGGSTDNDLLVAQCDGSTTCGTSGAPWSHTFSEADIATLSNFSGPLVLTSVQNSPVGVRLGVTTLIGSAESAVAVPALSPLGIAMLWGLLGVVGLRRLRA